MRLMEATGGTIEEIHLSQLMSMTLDRFHRVWADLEEDCHECRTDRSRLRLKSTMVWDAHLGHVTAYEQRRHAFLRGRR